MKQITHRLLLILSLWIHQAKSNHPIQPNRGQENKTPEQLKGVSIEERFGAVVDHSLVFTDHNAQTHRLGDFFGDKPVILTLNYWRCKSLCTFQLGNLAEIVSEVPWKIGKDYRMVTISFDPTDTSELAQEARNLYLSKGQLPHDTDWIFLTGEQHAIDSVTNSLGFFYKHDKESNEFAHSAALFFFSPAGRLSRYLYGIQYSPLDMRLSLTEAAEGKIGTLSDRILLTCFHYNPTTGKYDGLALQFLNVVAYLVLFVLVACIGWWVFKEARSKRAG